MGSDLDERREQPGEVERGEDDDDRTGADADDEHAVRGASYALHGPADGLPERGGGEDPGQHDQLGADEVARAASTSAVTASRLHAWTSQARLSGASSSAPRCSVTGLIGWTAASLRDSSSRPPPLPMAAPTASSRKPAKAAPRLLSRAASARSNGAEPPDRRSTREGTTAKTAVSTSTTARPRKAAPRRRTVRARNAIR